MKAFRGIFEIKRSMVLKALTVAPLLVLSAPNEALAQSANRQTDITFLAGYNQLTNGYANQTFASAIGNTILRGGLGLHAEVTYADREESGALFLGGISYNTDRSSFKVMAGTSTDVQSIFPDAYGRVSAEFRSDPASGWVVNPAFTVRDYRSGLTDQTAELRLVKYLPAGADSSIILEAVGREGFLSPGPSLVPSGLIGVTYSKYKTYSFGVAFDAGRAEYDSLIGVGSVNEPYYAVRPSAAMNINSTTEIFARGDYTHRDSYQSTGALAGIKFYLDQ